MWSPPNLNDKRLNQKLLALTRQNSLDRTPRSSKSPRKESSPGKAIIKKATIDMPLSN
jgi:hypothetical protein